MKLGSISDNLNDDQKTTTTSERMPNKPNTDLEKRVKIAILACLKKDGRLTYPELFIQLGMLQPKLYAEWQRGRVPNLEKVITCNQANLGRIRTTVRRVAAEIGLTRNTGPRSKMKYSNGGIEVLEYEYRSVYASKKPVAKQQAQLPISERVIEAEGEGEPDAEADAADTGADADAADTAADSDDI